MNENGERTSSKRSPAPWPAQPRQQIELNTLRTGDADLRFYITTVQDG